MRLGDTEKKKAFADWKAKRGEGMNSVENKPKEYGFSKEETAERWQRRYDMLMEKYKALKKELKNEEEASDSTSSGVHPRYERLKEIIKLKNYKTQEEATRAVIYALLEKVERQEKMINVLCDAIPTDENTHLLRGR